jgi:hypothetical protein
MRNSGFACRKPVNPLCKAILPALRASRPFLFEIGKSS